MSDVIALSVRFEIAELFRWSGLGPDSERFYSLPIFREL
jgi:hypothetical protein